MGKRKKSVCIVGFGETGKFVPWNMGDYEFWGFNALWSSCPTYRHPWTRWFEIHDLKQQERDHKPNYYHAHLRWMRGEREIPIYMQRVHNDIPMSKQFPKEDVEKLTSHGKYHCSSVDWMIAFAILEGFEAIVIYGIDFGPMDVGEPLSARACMEYWVGVAEGRGIEIEVIGGAAFSTYHLVKSRSQYGYDDLANEVAID